MLLKREQDIGLFLIHFHFSLKSLVYIRIFIFTLSKNIYLSLQLIKARQLATDIIFSMSLVMDLGFVINGLCGYSQVLKSAVINTRADL